jgi:hypothetical protein
VVAALPTHTRATTPMVRRWDASASQKAGAEYRPDPGRDTEIDSDIALPEGATFRIVRDQRVSARRRLGTRTMTKNGTPFEATSACPRGAAVSFFPSRYSSTATKTLPDTGKPRPIGVPGLTLCRNDRPAARHAAHNVIPGSPGRRASSWFSRRRGTPPASQKAGVEYWSDPGRDTGDWSWHRASRGGTGKSGKGQTSGTETETDANADAGYRFTSTRSATRISSGLTLAR